jgi:hypothetical protein
VNRLEDHIDTVKTNTEMLIDASKVIDLGVNSRKTENKLVCRHQNKEEFLI